MTHPFRTQDAAARDLRFDLPEINTWRVFNKAVTQESVLALAGLWEAQGYRFGCLCIDDGWQSQGLMGEWTADARRFTDPRTLAESLHARGYALRIWIAPAQVHAGTSSFDRLWPDAFLHNTRGEPSFYVGLGTYTLDIRQPDARRHVFESVQRAVRLWNADALKVDFPPFYRPDDEYYRSRDYDLPDADKQRMVGDFYALVREAADSVRPGIRLEAYPKCQGATPFLDDMIVGDLVGCDRSWPTLVEHARTMRRYIGDRAITPWFEMIWGEGADHPHSGVDWHAGFIEYLAASINLEFKLEHSFLPFDYPNADQIRCLSNLYGPRNRQVKVLVAGRRTFSVAELLAAGVHLDCHTRFLVAPEDHRLVQLQTAPLRSNAIDWRCRNVTTGERIIVRSRNEFWGGNTAACRVEFDAKAQHTYELWYDGAESSYFDKLLGQHMTRAGELGATTQHALPDTTPV